MDATPTIANSGLVTALMQEVLRERQQSLVLISQAWEDNLRIVQLTEQLQNLICSQQAQPVPPAEAEVQPTDPKEIRKAKILKYKAKMQRRRAKVGVTRECPGRKAASRMRARVQGKFAKMA